VASFLAFILWLAAPAMAPPQALQARTAVSGATVTEKSSEAVGSVAVTLIPIDAPATPPPSTVATGAVPVGARGVPGRGAVAPLVASTLHNLTAVSDPKGNFEFPTVPPGRYWISAQRDGFFRQERYRQGYSGPPQTILTVTEGQKTEQVILSLEEVPPITGRVYGIHGQSLAAAVVHAYQLEYTPYGRQLSLMKSELSNEGGEYRLVHLLPGNYILGASYSDIALRPWKSKLSLTPNLSSPDEGYSTVYFPGVLDVADAKWINLNSARDAGNTDILFRETEYFRFTAKVKLPPPAPTPSGCPCLRDPRIALLPPGSDLNSALDFTVQRTGVDFSVERLAKGDYVLVVVADAFNSEGQSVTRIVSDARPLHLTKDTEVTVDAQQPFEIPVNVMTIGGPAPRSLEIQLVRVDQLSKQTLSANPEAGGFTLHDVGPGTFDIFLKGMPANAYLQDAGVSIVDRSKLQIRVDGNMPGRQWVVSEDGMHARLVSLVPLSVTLNLTGNSATGKVTDASRKPFARAQVVLVPTNPSVRTRKDRYYVSTSDGAGAFQIGGIAPGAYMAYAFQELETGMYYDPEFNAQIASRGVRVNIGSGAGGSIDLTVITTEELARYIR